jgi:hypothetical protein
MMRNTKRRIVAGVGLPSTLVMIVCGSIVATAVLGLSLSSSKTSHRSVDKAQATALAESGVQLLYENIRRQMRTDMTYPSTLASTTAYVQRDGQQFEVGTYSARVVDLSQTSEDILQPGTTTKIGQRDRFVYLLEGQGTSKDGVSSKIRSSFTAVVEYTITAGAGGNFSVGPGAIVSNSKVEITTNGGFRTYEPGGSNTAHVIGNDGICWRNVGGPRVCVFDPNILDIQGGFLTTDGPGYTLTTSTDGIWNENGTTNYVSVEMAETSLTFSTAANSVGKLISPVQFPSATQVEGLRQGWFNTATATGAQSWPGGADSGSMLERPGDQWKIVQAPAYIDGDLDVKNGDVVRLMPNGDPAKNIVYVRGNVRNLGQLFNLGVTVVMEGKYTDGGSSEYRLDSQGSPMSDNEIMSKACFLSVNESRDAFSFGTNSSSKTGLIFSMRGGIQVSSSNAEFTGALFAGGSGDTGVIEINPNGAASFVVKYDPLCASPRDFGIAGPPVTTLTKPFDPGKLKGWVQVK